MKSFACRPEESRGRAFCENAPRDRTEYQRDCDRIVHTTAFRRLMHKTQVFLAPESDHVRTRLTHTIEVARAARALSNSLGLNADLAEAIALAHDLGHPPFGHAGEDALDEQMSSYGGFEHNAQSLRIVTTLVRNYMEFDGLNLTWECREGIAKHSGPLLQTIAHQADEVARIDGLELKLHGSGEAQVAAIADDVVYNCHDLQDGLRTKQFTLDDTSELELVGPILERARHRHPHEDEHKLMHLVVRTMFGELIACIVCESERRLGKHSPASPGEVRRCSCPVVGLDQDTDRKLEEVRQFLMQNMYNTDNMQRQRRVVCRFVNQLFEYFNERPSRLPLNWNMDLDTSSEIDVARTVADYISGMTDNFAINTFARINELAATVTLHSTVCESIDSAS